MSRIMIDQRECVEGEFVIRVTTYSDGTTETEVLDEFCIHEYDSFGYCLRCGAIKRGSFLDHELHGY